MEITKTFTRKIKGTITDTCHEELDDAPVIIGTFAADKTALVSIFGEIPDKLEVPIKLPSV
jgi:hypothetical protein